MFDTIPPRQVPLIDSDGLRVRRTLPTHQRSLIGAWCFLDHFGPDDVLADGGMQVPPHPHTGLQTVSWLFAGEVQHRDSAGHAAVIRPGEINLMTSGRGISHSEVSMPGAGILHGVQLWVALPDSDRFCDPLFEHYIPPIVELETATAQVFVGSMFGSTSPLRTFTPLVGVELRLDELAALDLPLDPGFEHGLLVDEGDLYIEEQAVRPHELVYLPLGRERVTLRTDSPTRAILIGGRPLGEQIIMWWNFIGRSHQEIVNFREQWQAEINGERERSQFGHPFGDQQSPLAAPPMPGFHLKARG